MTNNNGDMKQRIIEAAVQLFSKQGFNGTSTREIARHADISETSLFRHFPKKQDMFWTALQSRLDQLRLRKELREALEQVHDPKVVMPLIAEFFVEIATYQHDLLRLLGVSLLEMRPDGELVWREQFGPIFQEIARYLEHCIVKGTVRKLDTSITAISLFTTILLYEGVSRLLSGVDSYANAADAIASYSNYWLSVLSPISKSVMPLSRC